MRDTHTELYVHLVWGTWDRLPLLIPHLRTAIYSCIQAECSEVKAEILALGGIEDHVHLLVRIPPTLCISSFMKQVKGSSSHLVTQALCPGGFFKWQGGYGAFTLAGPDLARLKEYIQNQEQHHHEGSLLVEFEPESTEVKSAKADFVPLQARLQSPDTPAGQTP